MTAVPDRHHNLSKGKRKEKEQYNQKRTGRKSAPFSNLLCVGREKGKEKRLQKRGGTLALVHDFYTEKEEGGKKKEEA